MKSGVLIVDIGVKKHIPSHIKIEGHRALISYEGQLSTYFPCNEQGHQINECPRRRQQDSHTDLGQNSWASIVKRGHNNVIISECNNTTDALTSTIDKTQSSIVLTTKPSDSLEKQQTDPTTKEPHSSLTGNDSMTYVDYIQETENTGMLKEVIQMVPQVKKPTFQAFKNGTTSSMPT